MYTSLVTILAGDDGAEQLAKMKRDRWYERVLESPQTATCGNLTAYDFTSQPYASLGFVATRGTADAPKSRKLLEDAFPAKLRFDGLHRYCLEPEVAWVNKQAILLFGAVQHWLDMGELGERPFLCWERLECYLTKYYATALSHLMMQLAEELNGHCLFAVHDLDFGRWLSTQSLAVDMQTEGQDGTGI